MRLTLLRSASVVGVIIIVALVSIWLLRSPPDNVIPAEFRGVWLDRGAECQDTNAQVRITASTISYDQLSFKADGMAEKRADAISLSGNSFANGNAERETVQLKMLDNRAKLVIISRDLRDKGPFFRCSPGKE